eukprot:TRINITY_DN3320_c2_g2_i1.p1 TRINITY_DN3320_c2_g2~~TRINITY_DN3320_c2_g2_i1.p1  ORF type:complete len:251 (+),score=36.39 TRINITY_DN3320_c2_g2_i1:64-816(+)
MNYNKRTELYAKYTKEMNNAVRMVILCSLLIAPTAMLILGLVINVLRTALYWWILTFCLYIGMVCIYIFAIPSSTTISIDNEFFTIVPNNGGCMCCCGIQVYLSDIFDMSIISNNFRHHIRHHRHMIHVSWGHARYQMIILTHSRMVLLAIPDVEHFYMILHVLTGKGNPITDYHFPTSFSTENMMLQVDNIIPLDQINTRMDPRLRSQQIPFNNDVVYKPHFKQTVEPYPQDFQSDFFDNPQLMKPEML